MQMLDSIRKTMLVFPKSYINYNNELILIPNSMFISVWIISFLTKISMLNFVNTLVGNVHQH